MSDPNASPYIHWNEQGDSIIIDDSQAVSTRGALKIPRAAHPRPQLTHPRLRLAQFSGNVLKQVFGHTKFSVFVRLMKCAGFTKLARTAKEG
jgi:hypothetical protein